MQSNERVCRKSERKIARYSCRGESKGQRGTEWRMCEMNAQDDTHSCDSGGEGESFRRGFLLCGESPTSLYRGHIQNVSPQKHKFPNTRDD